MQEEKLKLLFQAVQILKNAMNWNDSDMYGVIRETVKLRESRSGEIFCKHSMFPRSENFYPTLARVPCFVPRIAQPIALYNQVKKMKRFTCYAPHLIDT